MARYSKKYNLQFLTIVIFLLILLDGTAAASPSTLYVGGGGIGNYTTIQAAINNASTEDTILVFPGTYTESVNISVENISIRSYSGNPEDTIVKHLGSGYNFNIGADNVTISGFNITGAGSTGIYISGISGANITNNKLSGIGCGIQMENSERCSLINNTVLNSLQRGFYLDSSCNCTLAENTISDIGEEGILLEDSTNCTLDDNTVSNTDFEGIFLYRSNSSTLINNTALDTDYGICLFYSDDCVLRNNTANSGVYGLSMWQTKSFILTGNVMSENLCNFYFDPFYDDLDNATGNIIETSNLVDGKPVYYLEGESSPSIGSDAGVVYCINCRDVEIKDLTLRNNTYGIFLYNTSSEIQNNTISNTAYGVTVLSSQNVSLTGNNFEHLAWGTEFYESMNITLTNNIIRNSIDGIYISDSENCTLTGNSVLGYVGNYNLFTSGNSVLVGSGENSFTRENTHMNSNSVQVSRPSGLLVNSINPALTTSTVSYSTVSYIGFKGIYLDSSIYCTLNNNTISNTSDDGIYFNSSEYCNLTDNTVSETYNGICLNASSSCNLTGNTVSNPADDGIDLDFSSSCNITDNTISNANDDGIDLGSSSNCNITGNTVSNPADEGICLEDSENCSLINNSVSNAYLGIYLYGSEGCVLRNNTAGSGSYGFILEDIENCTLTGNIMSENRYNFGLDIYDFDNATGNIIDTSNLVDGKPIYYLEGEPYPSIGSNAGVVYCINCGKAEIRDLVLQNNSQAILLYNTSSEMQNNTINNTIYGVMVLSTQDVRLSGSRIENSMVGVGLEDAVNTTLADNNVQNSFFGIQVRVSDNCTFTNNSVSNSTFFGLYTISSGDCTFTGNSVRNSIYGILTIYSENCTFTGNSVQGLTENSNLFTSNLFTSESSKLVSDEENTLLKENVLTNSNLVQASNYGYGIYSVSSINLVFEDNTVDRAGLAGIYLNGCQNVELVSNSVRDAGYMGIYAVGSSGMELLDNTVQNVTGQNNILLSAAGNSSPVSSFLVSESSVSSGCGIYLGYSEDLRLEGNIVEDSYQVMGICLYKPVNTTLESNTLDSCKIGLVAAQGGNCSISACSVTNCTSGGIFIQNIPETPGAEYTVTGCTVKGSKIGLLLMGESTLAANTLSGNSYGIMLCNANNNLISDNTMVENSLAGLVIDPSESEIISLMGLVKGVESPESSNNMIYNNYFNNVNNTQIHSAGNNFWNVSKTSGESIVGGSYLGGNYWANPGKTGFSENCADANRDGIADSSYEIANGNFDYLPLVIPASTTSHKSSANYIPFSGNSGITGIDSSQRRVAAGTQASFNFNNPTSGILGISFTPLQYSGNVIVRIEVLGSANSRDGLNGEVYQQMNILIGNDRFESESNINGASLNFRVSKSWVGENNIDISTITINRFHNDEWNALSTEMTQEDNDYYYFTAETPGFSKYAITGDKLGSETITPSEESENSTITGDEQTTAGDKKSPGFESTFAALGILASVFLAKTRILK